MWGGVSGTSACKMGYGFMSWTLLWTGLGPGVAEGFKTAGLLVGEAVSPPG